MSQSLPERPSLEHLKAQAKDLLAAYRADDPAAVARVRPFFPATFSVGLSEAQLVLAREYGFESWAKLKAQVALSASASSPTERADRLAEASTNGQQEAVLLLFTSEPGLAKATLAAACATGDTDAVEAFLAADPVLLNAKVGPRGWEPLLYVCYSCLLKEADYRPRLVATARLLLDRGADPNAHWLNPEWDDCPESCLYGATGVNDCPTLAEMLLKAGADPNDNESLYHSTELPTPDCMKILLRYGADVTAQNNALAHLLDREAPDWLPLMLGAAQDPAQIPPVLPHALRRGRSAEVFRLLIESGMPLDTPNEGGLTPYQSATRLGREDVAVMLAAAGADTTLTPADTILGRLARGEKVAPEDITPEVIQIIDAEPTAELVRQAERGNTAVLEALLAAGANPNVCDSHTTPLHLPASNGDLQTVRLLLRYGADPTLEDLVHKGHAVGWACFGSENLKTTSPETYVQVVEELLDAGGTVPETAWGSPEVQAVLVRRGAKPA
ncbi:MAG: ankyrin repeat domain-containing protein [Cytophagales bacterium]|nr:ankyrin repeat domain-containing protein [Armatimonadota bacterium]